MLYKKKYENRKKRSKRKKTGLMASLVAATALYAGCGDQTVHDYYNFMDCEEARNTNISSYKEKKNNLMLGLEDMGSKGDGRFAELKIINPYNNVVNVYEKNKKESNKEYDKFAHQIELDMEDDVYMFNIGFDNFSKNNPDKTLDDFIAKVLESDDYDERFKAIISRPKFFTKPPAPYTKVSRDTPKLKILKEMGVISDEFIDAVEGICARLDMHCNTLMATMDFETASTFSPRTQGDWTHIKKDFITTGLLQFTPFSAKRLGKSPDDLKKMSPLEQLDVVEEYFQMMKENYGAEYKRPFDIPSAVFYEKGIGKDPEFVVGKKSDCEKYARLEKRLEKFPDNSWKRRTLKKAKNQCNVWKLNTRPDQESPYGNKDFIIQLREYLARIFVRGLHSPEDIIKLFGDTQFSNRVKIGAYKNNRYFADKPYSVKRKVRRYLSKIPKVKKHKKRYYKRHKKRISRN